MMEIFKFLYTNHITPNGLFVLYSMNDKVGYPNYISHLTETHRLKLQGFIEGNDPKNYSITMKGFMIMKDVEKMMCHSKESVKLKSKYEDWQEHIVKYNSMFPTGKIEGCSVSYRTNPKELFERFKWFFIHFPEYSWDDVLTATKKYLKVFEDKGDNSYMQTSKYFIKKEDKSRAWSSGLATLCYNIANGNDVDADNGSYYFGP